MAWGDDDLALIYESEWKTRRSVVSTFSPANAGQGLKVLFDRCGCDLHKVCGNLALLSF